MSEVPAPRSVIESAPRVESRPPRDTTIRAFNHIYNRYEAAMSPLLTRLEAGENLTAEERRNANAFRVTRDGLRNVVGQEHQQGTPAIPDNLGSDEWNNVYKDAEGKVLGKQREGIVTNHMLDWIDGEIKNQGASTNAADMMSRDMLRASSGTYAELHATPGSMDRELRVRQEAGAIIHPDPTRDSTISQHDETNRQAHERADWQMAEDEIDKRLELVLPPPKVGLPEMRVVNPPTVRDSGETVSVHIPDSDGPPPFRAASEGSPTVVDGGGGEVAVPRVEVTSDNVPPAGRSIPDRLAPPPEPAGPKIIRPDGFAPYIIDDPKHPSNAEAGEPAVATEAVESVENPEAEAVARRADRLARLKGMPKAIWNRAQNFIKDRIPSVDLSKVPTIEVPTIPVPGRKFGGAVAMAALVAVIVANCTSQSGAPSKAEPFPGNQYGPNPKVEMVYDRPQPTTPMPAEEAAIAVAPDQNQVFTPAVEAKPSGGFEDGGGKSIESVEQDFSAAGEKQSLKGVTEDQLAQLLSPEYKAYVDQLRREGKVVDAERGASKDIVDKFKAKLVENFGAQEGQAKYDAIMSNLADQQKFVLENLNGPGGSKVGIGEDGDTIIRGPEWDGTLRLLDMGKDRDGFMTVINGITGNPYSSADAGILDEYRVPFNPAGGNP